MDRTYLADVSDIPPEPPESPLIGYPRNGDPTSGVRATKPGAWWYQMITEEMRNAIVASGQTPDPKKVDQLGKAISASGYRFAVAGGDADNVTAAFSPAVSALTNGLTVYVRAMAANTITTPSLKANDTVAKTIVKGNNRPLEMSDIAGAGHWLELQFDAVLDKWVLQNPAKGIDVSTGVPVGTIGYFASSKVPAGYLIADGTVVGRKTYPELFAAIGTAFGEGDGETTFNLPDLDRDIGAIVPFASHAMPADFVLCDGREVGREEYGDLFSVIGTTYGAGDGSTTFNLPDLIGRFAEGSSIPGTVKEAGLPNVSGSFSIIDAYFNTPGTNGAFTASSYAGNVASMGGVVTGAHTIMNFSATDSNPVYGASDTVQPPALTVCYGIKTKNQLVSAIKAFDAAVDPGLVDLTELANEVKRNQTPVGTVAWFAMSVPPAGYLIADGSAVGRETYRKLFGAIGTTYGEGDGSTTFNLPDLIGRFAEGSATPGTVKEAGLPNITGTVPPTNKYSKFSGAFTPNTVVDNISGHMIESTGYGSDFNAKNSNPIYGNSDTVQPPALTLLPCIKVFDGAVHTGLVDVTALAQEMAGKVDKVIDGKSIAYIVDSYRDGNGNWYRKWSDGWVEQGGHYAQEVRNAWVPVTLTRPYAIASYHVNAFPISREGTTSSANTVMTRITDKSGTAFSVGTSGIFGSGFYWYSCGQGA